MTKDYRPRLTDEEYNLVLKHRARKLENISENSVLDDYLIERGINKQDVVSVKHWQNAAGDPRFSIVTKEELVDQSQILAKVHEFIGEHSKKYKKIVHKPSRLLCLTIDMLCHAPSLSNCRLTNAPVASGLWRMRCT